MQRGAWASGSWGFRRGVVGDDRPVFDVFDLSPNNVRATATIGINNSEWFYIVGVYDSSIDKLFIAGKNTFH